jgi:hypothetical protein
MARSRRGTAADPRAHDGAHWWRGRLFSDYAIGRPGHDPAREQRSPRWPAGRSTCGHRGIPATHWATDLGTRRVDPPVSASALTTSVLRRVGWELGPGPMPDRHTPSTIRGQRTSQHPGVSEGGARAEVTASRDQGSQPLKSRRAPISLDVESIKTSPGRSRTQGRAGPGRGTNTQAPNPTQAPNQRKRALRSPREPAFLDVESIKRRPPGGRGRREPGQGSGPGPYIEEVGPSAPDEGPTSLMWSRSRCRRGAGTRDARTGADA